MAGKVKLTAGSVRKLAADDTRGTRYYDSELAGFGVTVYHPATGRKLVYFLRHGARNERRFITLGTGEELSAAQARAKAQAIRDAAKGTTVPEAERRRRRTRCPTLAEWVETYTHQARAEQKRSTFYATSAHLRRAVAELGATTPLDELGRGEIQAARLRLADKHGIIAANRWLSTLRTSLNEAVARGLIKGNPAAGLKKLRGEPAPRRRILDAGEMSRLLAAVSVWADPWVRITFLLLVFTGARRGEVLAARWDEIDIEAGTWVLPDPKSGRPQTVILPEVVVDALRRTPRLSNSPWVVPSRRDPSVHKYDLFREWKALCMVAGIRCGRAGGGAIIHDLRRSLGALITNQADVLTTSRLLRHADVRTTAAHYSPPDAGRLRAALDRAAASMLAPPEEEPS